MKRCLTLAAALAERGVAAVLVTRPTEASVLALIEEAGVPFRVLPDGTGLADEPAALDALGLAAPAALVLDVSHHQTLRQVDAIAAYFAALARRFRSLIVINSQFEESLLGRFDLPVDLGVIPYAGARPHDEGPWRGGGPGRSAARLGARAGFRRGPPTRGGRSAADRLDRRAAGPGAPPISHWRRPTRSI